MDLHESLERVDDLGSFLEFVGHLLADREDAVREALKQPVDPFGRGPRSWENHTIEAFLEAALRWSDDSRGRAMGLPERPSWRALATFLLMGKIYE